MARTFASPRHTALVEFLRMKREEKKGLTQAKVAKRLGRRFIVRGDSVIADAAGVNGRQAGLDRQRLPSGLRQAQALEAVEGGSEASMPQCRTSRSASRTAGSIAWAKSSCAHALG